MLGYVSNKVKKYILLSFIITSFFLSFLILSLDFKIFVLPSFFLSLGLLIRLSLRSHFLTIFSFLFPVISGFSYFENKGLPYNYLLLPIFFLVGMFLGEIIFQRKKTLQVLNRSNSSYIVFLSLVFISAFFVILRWSNITLSPLAVFKDTPIAPSGERISFGIIFLSVYLGLFSLSYLYYLYLRQVPDKKEIIFAFLAGQSLSIVFSLFQNFFRWRLFLSRKYNGFASDSSSFGFLCSVAILLSWYLFFKYKKRAWSVLFFAISLIGIFNSFVKAAAIALFFAILLYLFSWKGQSKSTIVFILLIGLLIPSLLFFSYDIGKRSRFVREVKQSIQSISDIISTGEVDDEGLRKIVASRHLVWNYSFECLKKFPLCGVGAGNFVFWVKYNWYGKKPYHHLPNNQYLFFSSSIGTIGLLVFLFFIVILLRYKKRVEQLILFLILVIIFFNHYLWFPESILAFWLVASLGEERSAKEKLKTKKIDFLVGFLLIIFVVCNIYCFDKLHPVKWAKETNTRYDYSFWYKEINPQGQDFRWTKNKAGIYISLDKKGHSQKINLFCGAPLKRLPQGEQRVEVYWKGKLYRSFVFKENKDFNFWIKDQAFKEGFLEFRIYPCFNLKKMNLGEDTRDLGIQVNDFNTF